jgi:glycosyltransferase involved in cell wall biosynthesis
MHVGVEATTLRSQQLGGVWRYTESLIRALGRLASPHRYSLLFLNTFKPWARVPAPHVAARAMRLVEVTSVSNFLFTFVMPIIPRGGPGPTVESFVGSVDVFHSVNGAALPQRQGRRVVTVQDLTCLRFPHCHPWARRMLFRVAIRRAVRLADAIIVPSSATERDLSARFPGAERKVRVIPLAHGTLSRAVLGHSRKRRAGDSPDRTSTRRAR